MIQTATKCDDSPVKTTFLKLISLVQKMYFIFRFNQFNLNDNNNNSSLVLLIACHVVGVKQLAETMIALLQAVYYFVNKHCLK